MSPLRDRGYEEVARKAYCERGGKESAYAKYHEEEQGGKEVARMAYREGGGNEVAHKKYHEKGGKDEQRRWYHL